MCRGLQASGEKRPPPIESPARRRYAAVYGTPINNPYYLVTFFSCVDGVLADPFHLEPDPASSSGEVYMNTLLRMPEKPVLRLIYGPRPLPRRPKAELTIDIQALACLTGR